jgi:hypothetical protein
MHSGLIRGRFCATIKKQNHKENQMDQNAQQPQPSQPQQPINPIDTPAFHQAASTVSAALNPQPAPAPVMPAQPQKAIVIEFEPDLKFTVTADVVDDMRFMELYAEVSEDQLKITKLIKWLIGADNFESIFTYYESRNQKFTITKFGEVFEKLDKDLNANPDFLSR